MSPALRRWDDTNSALTRARREIKYLIPRGRLPELSKAMAEYVPMQAATAHGDSSGSLGDHAITTVYFDTSDRDLFHAADATDRNVKLRVRAYDSVHPQLRAIADRERRACEAIVWLELKRRNGDHTTKRRAAVPQPDLEAFLDHGTRSTAMGAIVREIEGTDAVLDELRGFILDFGKPLKPASVVNYVRSAWQAVDGSVRVTIDRDVTFHPPTVDQWRRQDLTDRSNLGPPVGAEASCVIEVKTGGDFPAWLTEALRTSEANRVDYSKFVSAMLALHGR